MSWDRERIRALEEMEMLALLLSDPDASESRVTAGYLATKRVLAEAFRARGLERYGNPEMLNATISLVEYGIRETFPTLDVRYRTVRGYGSVHAALLCYLSERVGTNVAADELRILTCDAVHTERRARDLRDLGFDLKAVKAGGLQAYCLVDVVPDVADGISRTVTRNVRNDRLLSTRQGDDLIEQLGLDK